MFKHDKRIKNGLSCVMLNKKHGDQEQNVKTREKNLSRLTWEESRHEAAISRTGTPYQACHVLDM